MLISKRMWNSLDQTIQERIVHSINVNMRAAMKVYAMSVSYGYLGYFPNAFYSSTRLAWSPEMRELCL